MPDATYIREIKIDIQGPLLDQAAPLRPVLLRNIAGAFKKQNQLTIARAVKNYLSFPKNKPPVPNGLRTISGHLRRSIHASGPAITGDRVWSAIGSNVVYAAIHEFGGKTKPHTITARRAKALAFTTEGGKFTFYNRASYGKLGRKVIQAAPAGFGAGGAVSQTIASWRPTAKGAPIVARMLYRRSVKHPGSNIPARPYLGAAIADRLQDYRGAVADALRLTLQKAAP